MLPHNVIPPRFALLNTALGAGKHSIAIAVLAADTIIYACGYLSSGVLDGLVMLSTSTVSWFTYSK